MRAKTGTRIRFTDSVAGALKCTRLTLEIFDRPLRSLDGVTKLPHQAAGVFGRPGQPVNGAESDPDVKSLHYLHSRCEVPPAHAS